MKKQDRMTKDYYDHAQILYDLFWSKKALHYGFWNKDTKKLKEAIENANKFVAKLLKPKKDDKILDTGCGVGGSCLFFAKNFKSKVTGIGLSEVQLKKAKKYAKDENLDNLLNFKKMNFNNTDFKDKSFDKVFAIEGACYAENKYDFLKEMYRILKPNGKIVVVDGFLKKRKFTKEERKAYKKSLTGWKVPNLSHRDDFKVDLENIGFKNIKFFDKTKNVIPSAKRIKTYGYLLFPFSFILSKLKLITKDIHENSICMINQKKVLETIAYYGTFSAEKKT